MFQLIAGRAAVSEVDFPDVAWDTSFLPSEYTLSQSNKAYARNGVTSLRDFVFADKQIRVDQLGGGYGYYWEIALTGSAIMDGYIGVMDIDTAESDFDQDTDPLVDAAMYRGDGTTWIDGTQVAAGGATFGDGKTLMMAFDPLDGAIWTGVDGVWDRTPWVDNPAGYAPLAGFGGLFVAVAQARAAADAGVLKAEPKDFTYPVPPRFIPLADTNPNPIMRPQFWTFTSSSATVHSTDFDRSSTFQSTNGLFTNRNAVGYREIGGGSGSNVPAAGYYFEMHMSPVWGSTIDECSVGFLPQTQWNDNFVPETLQWRGDGRLYFNGAQQFPRPPEWTNEFEEGSYLMFCFNPHTGSLWLGQDGTWFDDPVSAAPTFSYSIALDFRWKVCVHHRGDTTPFTTKEATIFALPEEFRYTMPTNAIPLGQYV
jgi:hypothetical protein